MMFAPKSGYAQFVKNVAYFRKIGRMRKIAIASDEVLCQIQTS